MASKTIENKLVTAAANAYLLKQINRIIKESEEIQQSQESAYTKQQAKLSAYKEIVELLK